ncbi:hypothetical protein SAY86_022723 [Trapa natans]|uniref:DUF4005 domain-containing protein n=1 Tax=Trapa natans TaxID=22666 RepID=A0AAN7RAW7_TRANT|nr:hypothetical protein SAY86_022723 [Trapa natans]
MVEARKALRALRGLVKLQALVRGQLVRRRANATLRRMQAMALEESRSPLNPISSTSTHMRSGRSDGFRPTHHEINDGVEMDIGEAMLPTMEDRGGYSYVNHRQSRRAICRLSAWMSPRTCSGRFQDYNYDAICTATSSPQCYSVRPNIDIPRAPLWSPRPDYIEPVSNSPIPPNYMAETESSRAKARSHSAPKQRTVDDPEKQPGKRRRRRVSMEGGTDVLRTASRMQRSTSLLGSTATRNRQYPSSIRLDRSSVSLGDSECGSTSSVLMDTNYFESPVWYEDIKAPSVFSVKNVGKTIVARTQGTNLLRDSNTWSWRYHYSLADLQGDEDHAYRMIRLGAEDVWIRGKMRKILASQATCDLNEIVRKFIPEMIWKEIEKATGGIYPLQNVFIRKVEILKAPKFHLGKLMEVHRLLLELYSSIYSA